MKKLLRRPLADLTASTSVHWQTAELEPRLMLAADAGACVGEAVTAEAAEIAQAVPGTQANETCDGSRAGDGSQAAAQHQATQIVLVDAAVSDFQQLAEHLPADAELLLLDADLDGVQQISDALRGRSGVRTIHLLTHGEAGAIRLGSQLLDQPTLLEQADAIRGWSTSLTDGADILLYGCQTAAGDNGAAFIRALADLTGADVAASTDITGHAALGGDWDLERQTGTIESALVFDASALESYQGTLPISIRAAGATGRESMALQIDGVTVQTWDNIGGDYDAGQFETFHYDAAEGVSADRIRVAFTNDQYIPGRLDRNLRVDSITVDRQTLQAEAPTVFSTGTWEHGAITSGFKRSEFLHADGYFQFAADEQQPTEEGSLLKIRAAGDTGREAMELRIDGQTVQTWDRVGGNAGRGRFRTFTYQADETITADRVQIAFTNDFYVEGRVDRNLRVDSLEIDGRQYQTEAPEVFSTGTWLSDEVGIAAGYAQSEYLHADGYFQYAADTVSEYRSIDGSGNNLQSQQYGAAGEPLLRSVTPAYADGIAAPAGQDRPSPREVSNIVVAQEGSILNDRQLSDMVWQWGQFIDHDITLTPVDEDDHFDVPIPERDPYFDPAGTGTVTLPLPRSTAADGTGTDTSNPRQQVNVNTAFIDGSMIYGSDAERAAALRMHEGGRLATSDGDLLPYNTAGLENAETNSPDHFLAGDIRANEQAGLTAMHTLWVREHNHWADKIAAADPTLSDEDIYQQARQIVIGEIQAITLNEYLPALLGRHAIDTFQGYDATVDPGISNLFATAGFRYGHSTLSSTVLRLDNDGNEIAAGNLSLAEAFFSPHLIAEEGIDSLLKGLSSQVSQEIDPYVIDDVRNFLFGPPGAGGLDLASLNIQRGREHGLPDYNTVREQLGLQRVECFADITSDVQLQQRLEAAYGSVDNIDVWVGTLAEDHLPGGSVGELLGTVIVDQFQRLRDGDRLWYQETFSGQQLQHIERTRLSDVIERNTDLTSLQRNVFFVPDNNSRLV
ncbi:peroxidase family protein [Roseimaritima ulvae]|uniref:peroxidase family protein n=1 Tax=Roseimaritima ulvae TaxID=980254 RepID=UPI001AF00D66|nr:peroxidase family protein [Roseimaritima ulvae]